MYNVHFTVQCTLYSIIMHLFILYSVQDYVLIYTVLCTGLCTLSFALPALSPKAVANILQGASCQNGTHTLMTTVGNEESFANSSALSTL